jgi:hypothetical protein
MMLSWNRNVMEEILEYFHNIIFIVIGEIATTPFLILINGVGH